MAKKYIIRDGFSFICENNEVKTGGAVVELDDDVAANHAHKLELVAEPVSTPLDLPAQPSSMLVAADPS